MKNEDTLFLRIIKSAAYIQHTLLRKVPNFITNLFPPLLMGKEQLRRSRNNPYPITTTLTNQSICAKHCGNCPSNPFTHGGLYCTSGKSTKKVEERGCHCFECELFEKCGGLGYFCKFGSAEQMQRDPKIGSELNHSMSPISMRAQKNLQGNLVQTEALLSKINISKMANEDSYHRRFIDSLVNKKESEIIISSQTSQKTTQKMITVEYEALGKKVVIPYGKNILDISLASKIPHTHVCGGRAKCSTCRVLVVGGTANLPKRNTAEEIISINKQFPPRVRLACQTIPQGDIKIRRLVHDKSSTKEAITNNQENSKFFGIDSHAAVLFADIRAFTTFSESNLTFDVVQMLNEYFSTISEPIDRYGGYVDKYMGDGIMAIFGLEKKEYSPELAALNASLDMLEALGNFNKNLLAKYRHQFKIGIGIDAGEVVMAKLGFAKKSQFTGIGDVVNTSARIEAQTKEQKVNILVSHNVYKVTKDQFTWGKKVSLQLKGKVSITTLYEPTSKVESSETA